MHMGCQVPIPTKMLFGKPCLPGSLRWSESGGAVLSTGSKPSPQLLLLPVSKGMPCAINSFRVNHFILRGSPTLNELPYVGYLVNNLSSHLRICEQRGQWAFYTKVYIV